MKLVDDIARLKWKELTGAEIARLKWKELTGAEIAKGRSRRPQNNYGRPQDSENAIHRRERSNSIHRSRMCRQCPAGREERHLHLPQNCKYGFQGRGGVQGRDGFGINQRNGFSQVNRGGFGNERGRGGFQILRRQN